MSALVMTSAQRAATARDQQIAVRFIELRVFISFFIFFVPPFLCHRSHVTKVETGEVPQVACGGVIEVHLHHLDSLTPPVSSH